MKKDYNFSEVTVRGIKGLYTPFRISKEDIPSNMYHYQIRHGDKPHNLTIEASVLINHFGDVLLYEELIFPKDDCCIELTDEDL